MEPYLIEHSVQFISSLNNTVSVIAVHHKDETLSVLEVVPPQGTDLVFQRMHILNVKKPKQKKTNTHLNTGHGDKL